MELNMDEATIEDLQAKIAELYSLLAFLEGLAGRARVALEGETV